MSREKELHVIALIQQGLLQVTDAAWATDNQASTFIVETVDGTLFSVTVKELDYELMGLGATSNRGDSVIRHDAASYVEDSARFAGSAETDAGIPDDFGRVPESAGMENQADISESESETR